MKHIIILWLGIISAISHAEEKDYNKEMQTEYDTAIETFENGNKVDACHHLKLSKSYAKHSDNIKAYDQLIIMYEKLCNDND